MFAPEGYFTIAVIFFTSAGLAWLVSNLNHWISVPAYILLLVLCGLILFFFRDPQRSAPDEGDNLILAPADGRIVQIRKENYVSYLNAGATRVSIFLSPLDVHVNRVPVTGRLEYVKYFPGKYLMAWEDHASAENERAHFGVLHPSGIKILFKQITGFMARRIVYHIEEGDMIKAGDRFGIMKFGSRMDILMPEGVDIKVTEGERTVAGESVIAKIIQL